MSLKSVVGVARPGSPSLRATVPEGIVAFLDLKEGEKLEWKMEIMNNERVVVVRKMLSDEEAKQLALKYAKKKEK
jgi:hypothetical protein